MRSFGFMDVGMSVEVLRFIGLSVEGVIRA